MALASFSACCVSPGPPPSIPQRKKQASLSSSPSAQGHLHGILDPPGRLLSARRSAAPAAPRCAHSTGAREGDHQPRENVMKLYTAVKDGSTQQVSDLMGRALPSGAGEGDRGPLGTVLQLYAGMKDGNIPFLGPDSDGKKGVLQFFSSLIGLSRNNVEFVIKPTQHEGTDVGLAWRLEWKKAHKPVEGGYGFQTVHHYQGRMCLRNVEMFVEPILHIRSLILKSTESLRSNLDQITAASIFKENGRTGFTLSLLLLLAMAFSFMVVKKFPR